MKDFIVVFFLFYIFFKMFLFILIRKIIFADESNRPKQLKIKEKNYLRNKEYILYIKGKILKNFFFIVF